jgi:pimeloyl-ACP methyl ester carboxylesterase
MGSSVGGATAINAALVCPERVAALVLAAPGLGGYHFQHSGTRRQWGAIHAAIKAGNYYRAAELEIKLWVVGPYRRPSQVDLETRALVGVMLRQMYLTPLDRAIEDALDPPAVARLGEIDAPTLLINGALDLPDILAIGDQIKARLPGCQRVMIQDCAHLPNLEYPDVFNMHALAFLQSIGLAE